MLHVCRHRRSTGVSMQTSAGRSCAVTTVKLNSAYEKLTLPMKPIASHVATGTDKAPGSPTNNGLLRVIYTDLLSHPRQTHPGEFKPHRHKPANAGTIPTAFQSPLLSAQAATPAMPAAWPSCSHS